MASFEGSIGIPNGGFNLKVEYSITQSIDGNYSDVSATGYVKRNKSSYHPYNSQSSSNLTIDGSSAGYNGAYNLGSDGYKAIISHSKRVYHNSDGTKSINISFSFDGLLSNWYPKGNISQTITLPTIYNYPYIISADNFTIGNNINIKLYNPLGRQCNLYFLGNDNSVICTASRSINGNTSISNTSEEIDSQYASIPNSNVGNYKVRLVVSSLSRDTTVNGAEYRTNTDNCKPTFSDFTFEDVNATTLALTGNNQNIINRYSNVKAIITALNKATAQKYATMSKYSFVCGNSQTNINYSSSETVEGTINGVKSGVFNVYAIDSRTNSTVVTKIANEVIEYNDLIKNSINVSRQNGVSETTSLSIYGKIDLVDFGQVVNSIQSAKYRYKATDSQTWSNYTNITLTVDSNGNYSFNGNIQGDTNTGFDIGNSYNIEVVISDELSSVTFTANLGSGIPNIALHKNGVGIMGKYDTTVGGLLQVGGANIITDFSTNEVKLPIKWIDGKPIYRKVFNRGNNISSFNHNIANVDLIWIDSTHSIRKHPSGNVFNMVGGTNDSTNKLGIYVNDTEVYIDNIAGISPSEIYITLEYTKTTDT